MFEPGCRGKQNVLSGTSAAAMCLKKALMNGGGRRGVARVWGESSAALLSSGSMLLECTIPLITRQEDTQGCCMCVSSFISTFINWCPHGNFSEF